MRKTPPATIPLEYDYQLRMSPSSSTAANYYDNQTTSLFGDPVPPVSEDFLENLDSHLYGSLRRSSIVRDFPKPNSFDPSRPNGDISPTMQTLSNIERLGSPRRSQLPTRITAPIEPPSRIHHLRPEIRVLPGSDSSSDSRISPINGGGVDGGNGNIMENRVNSRGPIDVDSDNIYQHQHYQDYGWDTGSRITISEGYQEKNDKFREQLDSDKRSKRLFTSEPFQYTRQMSTESYSSSEWFKPSDNYQEWTRIPRLRPSSKNVLSIKHSQQQSQHESPVATLIHDSNGSSSSEEKNFLDIGRMQDSSIQVRSKISHQKIETEPITSEMIHPTGLPPVAPKRDVSPVILTNSITTGADYRVSPPRLHKKTSFTIIAEKSPQSSRAQSPPLQMLGSGRVSPFFGRGFKEPPRPSSQPVSSTSRLRLPILGSASNINTSDDSPRPSVQFNMSSLSGRVSPSKSQAKGILHKKPDLLQHQKQQQQYNDEITHTHKVRSYDALPRITGPLGGEIPRPPPRRLNKSSLDLYAGKKSQPQKSLIKSSNPTSQQKGLLRVINSADSSPSRIPVRMNLTASMDDLTLKRRPLSLSPLRGAKRRSSISPERRSSSQTEPRSSIVSLTSDRRSSNLSSVTTSDFSFRRPSNSSIQPPVGRRKSIFQPPLLSNSIPKFDSGKKRVTSRAPRKVAKPTTLSPIIGTPNREGPSSSEDVENIFLQNARKNSGTKIPVRDGSNLPSASTSRAGSRTTSRAGSRTTSRAGSRATSRPNSLVPSVVNSRSNSPIKDYISISQSNSRMTSKSPSRATSQPSSRQTSRPVSRSNSRQTTRIQSRSNSRLSQRASSPGKNKSLSPPKSRKVNSTKSRSPSPKKINRRLQSPSKSPKRSGNLNRERDYDRSSKPSSSRKSSPSKQQSDHRRSSPMRSSIRKEPASAKKTSNNIRKPESSVKRTPSTVRKEKNLKREDSNLKRSNSNLKQENLSREPSLLLMKSSSSSNLKREPSNLNKSNAGIKRESSSIKKSSTKKETSPLSTKRIDGVQKSTKDSTTVTKIGSNVKKGSANSVNKPVNSNLGKKLEKKNSFRNQKKSAVVAAAAAVAEFSGNLTTASGGNTDRNESVDDNGGKLVPLTKHNVVSMTTAAITAQPVQITTAVTNQMPLNKTNSSGQLLVAGNTGENSTGEMLLDDVKEMLPAAILEKSTKTLENIQKTVTEATDEIHKTINENLTDLKTLESDIGKMVEDSGKPAPFEKSDSLQTIMENPAASEHRSASTNSISGGPSNNDNLQQAPKSPMPVTQPIEADVSVISMKKGSSEKFLSPNVNHNNNNNNNNNNKNNNKNEGLSSTSENPSEIGKNHGLHEDMAERVSERAISVLPEVECESENLQNYEEHEDINDEKPIYATTKDDDPKRNVQSSDDSEGHKTGGYEMGGDGDNNNKGSGSQEYLDEENSTPGCCKCCSRFCMPCRRCQCSKCCRKKTEMETAVMVTEIDEKPSCWRTCCKKKTENKTQSSIEEKMQKKTMETISEEPEMISRPESPKQNKCRLCLRKFFCCKATNKVEAVVSEVEEVKKCCFCIPCKTKKKEEIPAWQERRESILSAPPLPGAKSNRILEKLMCWKKQKPLSESRRQSMNSKKQSIAPTIPPEDTRPKLHVDLVEFNSKMKGAIPVMPLPLAWFCMVFNCLIPGLGTIFSGFFCLCVGIPRFSQYDSAKARFGSLIINCIVGIAQLFCVLFCFVGWGWSIWWGTIMLKTARKLRKIRKVERLEMEEEQRQAAAAAAAAAQTAAERDVEAAKS